MTDPAPSLASVLERAHKAGRLLRYTLREIRAVGRDVRLLFTARAAKQTRATPHAPRSPRHLNLVR